MPYWPHILLPPFEVNIGPDLWLSMGGRIDRVDLAPAADGFYLRVIDYKTGREKLELPRVLTGVQLQLMVYFWAALKHLVGHGGIEALHPAGALYFQVQKPLLKVDEPELSADQLKQMWLKQFKLNGWLVDEGPGLHMLHDNAMEHGVSSMLVPLVLTKSGTLHGGCRNWVYSLQEWRLLLQNTGRLLKYMGQNLMQGQVAIAPLKVDAQTACDYCPYKAICRFDLTLPENTYRHLKLDMKELRQMLSQAATQKEALHFDFHQLD